MVIQIIVLALLLFVVPILTGGIFVDVDKAGRKLLFRWVSGQLLLWMGFQVICVPLILKEGSFRSVVNLYLGYTAALLLFVAAAGIRRWGKGMGRLKWFENGIFSGRLDGSLILWLIFWCLLVFQLVLAVRLAYVDGDDSYYVAVSSAVEASDRMYLTIPYTGTAAGLDLRHGLAPFPVWIAFLARLSGMKTVAVAQTMLPLALISMTYAIFYLLGEHLFPEKGVKLPLFLIFTELLIVFGDHSIYTVENFMLARSRQGKAALGSIVIPALFLVLMILLERLKKGEKIPPLTYLLLAAVAASGCLCTTLGSLIVGGAVAIVGLLGAVCYRKPGVLLPMAACCIPCVCYALLYLFLNGGAAF